MLHNGKVGSKLIINGFTINPIKNEEAFKITLNSLFDYDYKQKHICDFDVLSTHTNYLKKPIKESFVTEIRTQFDEGIFGLVMLENGYYILRILYNKYPAEIQLDLYLDDNMVDPDLIIDHMCAPAVPFDGLGMFDYTYSLSKVLKPSTILSDSNNNIRYTNNDAFNITQYNSDENYSIILNQLKDIHCFYCDSKGEVFGFRGESRKIISICRDHLNSFDASHQEPGHGSNKNKDQRFVKQYRNSFVKIFDVDSEGNKISKHIKENNAET